MKLTAPTTIDPANATRILRRAGGLADAKSYSRSGRPNDRSDDLRLKAALKQAVLRDLAPQTLIDAIKHKIRDTK